jgi:dihydroorotate dehydrogenase
MILDLAARLLSALPAETAHEATLGLTRAFAPLLPRARTDDPRLEVNALGLSFPNPIGLAAGFDKDARVPDAMLKLGFGFVECGTVTPKPQMGNPRPRLFRLREDRAVINRMGFNNRGLERFAASIVRRGPGVVGANIGANKDAEDRIGDYVAGLRRLWGLADYFTVNISSPNTPGLRALQSGDALTELLGRIAETRTSLPGHAPIFLKVAPDLDEAGIEAIAEALAAAGLDGAIVSNTTTSRPAGLKSGLGAESGGLSGAPLMALSTQVLGQFHAATRGRFALIGVGGIATGADAYAKIRAGASAVQLYSAMVFEGPGLVTAVCRDLAARLAADGFGSVADAVGRR